MLYLYLLPEFSNHELKNTKRSLLTSLNLKIGSLPFLRIKASDHHIQIPKLQPPLKPRNNVYKAISEKYTI